MPRSSPARFFAYAILLLACLGPALPAKAAPALVGADHCSNILWSIGIPDGSSIEFASRARSEVVYRVGESVPSRDFPGSQEGSVGPDGQAAERPYTIAFDLAEPPRGNYELVLDLIYQDGSPRQLKIRVNLSAAIETVAITWRSQ